MDLGNDARAKEYVKLEIEGNIQDLDTFRVRILGAAQVEYRGGEFSSKSLIMTVVFQDYTCFSEGMLKIIASDFPNLIFRRYSHGRILFDSEPEITVHNKVLTRKQIEIE